MSERQDIASTLASAQSNPSGPEQGDIAALLRRVADFIDELGGVQIEDITSTSAANRGA